MENTKSNQLLIQQTTRLLQYTFVIVPIVAGLDKFANLLTDWSIYLNPSILDLLPFSGAAFLMVVGVIEIAAGVIVWRMPEFGGYIVSGWLVCIALTLLLGFNYVDVAVRDVVMAISAFSMARLTKAIK